MSSPKPPVSPREKAQTYLAQSSHFRLGVLPTETPHPKTAQLSELASNDLEAAIELLKEVELEALKAIPPKLNLLEAMAGDVRATLLSGGRIFLCGCGATGRLSLSLETLWREETVKEGHRDLSDRVISFIAGGDFALVRSVENFEDYPEYGARQLRDLRFGENDLLISSTEGGETPFVIGATEEAARISKRKPYFNFCNPEEILIRTVERSQRILTNPNVISICLETGPMAVAGSTRMQATTVQMLAVGATLFEALHPGRGIAEQVEDFRAHLARANLKSLAPLIRREADTYSAGEFCVHRATDYAITVLTDTTERSPTFSLVPFENILDPNPPHAWTYLSIPSARDSKEAWRKILNRDPRPVEWEGVRERFGGHALLGFDFGPQSGARRAQTLGHSRVHFFDIERGESMVHLSFDGREAQLARPKNLLTEHLLLKSALNISSTLAMGRLGRFRGNLMLFVRAANNKLVDRSIRFIQILLKETGVNQFSYDDICHALFETSALIRSDEPVVIRTYEKLLQDAARYQPAPGT